MFRTSSRSSEMEPVKANIQLCNTSCTSDRDKASPEPAASAQLEFLQMLVQLRCHFPTHSSLLSEPLHTGDAWLSRRWRWAFQISGFMYQSWLKVREIPLVAKEQIPGVGFQNSRMLAKFQEPNKLHWRCFGLLLCVASLFPPRPFLCHA